MTFIPMSAAACTWLGFGSINADTVVPTASRVPTMCSKPLAKARTSRPPSVVISALRSGTKQQDVGFISQAMLTISAVAANSRFNGTFNSRFKL